MFVFSVYRGPSAAYACPAHGNETVLPGGSGHWVNFLSDAPDSAKSQVTFTVEYQVHNEDANIVFTGYFDPPVIADKGLRIREGDILFITLIVHVLKCSLSLSEYLAQ